MHDDMFWQEAGRSWRCSAHGSLIDVWQRSVGACANRWPGAKIALPDAGHRAAAVAFDGNEAADQHVDESPADAVQAAAASRTSGVG